MLCWGLVEQARQEHMSDEYDNRYIIIVPPSPSWVKVRDVKLDPSELNKRGEVKRTNTGLPNTTYHMMKLHGNNHSLLLVRTVYYNISAFWNQILSVPPIFKFG